MRFDDIAALVRNVPFIKAPNARWLYDLIVRERLSSILELGFGHGTATCYMAAALEEVAQQGTIVAVDLLKAVDFSPSIEQQLAKTKLGAFVEIVRMQTGYTWFLHDEIKRRSTGHGCLPHYDLCIIDGPKNWTIDGCAFFLADKLLRNGAWLVFDDYDWTYGAADRSRAATDGITHRKLSSAELNTPHIREIFELLVKQHPSYRDFAVLPTGWAIARKRG